MKTIYPFRTKDNPLTIEAITALPLPVRGAILVAYPRATHIVVGRNGITYAFCGSLADAQSAKTKLETFNTIA